METKILTMDEIVKNFPADQVRLLKVETEQRTLEERVEPRISSVEGKLEDIEAAVTELSNNYRNDQTNNVANNIDLDEHIKEQVREVASIKVDLADLESQTEILKGNNENFISESQISALRSKLTEFETNQNGIHSELVKLIRATKSAKEQNDLYKEKNNLDLEEINRQVGLLQSGGTKNTAASNNNNDLFLAQNEEKISLVLRLLWENLISEIEKIFTSEKLLQSGVYDYPGLEENREKQGIVLIEKGTQDFVHTVYSKPTTLVPMIPRVIVVDEFMFRLANRKKLQYGAINENNEKENCKLVIKKKDFYFCEANSSGKLHECAFCHLTDRHDECTFVQLDEKEDKERTTVWIETDNKLIESKKEEKKEGDKNEEEKEKVENSVIKNVYFLNAQTLRVEVNEWISKNMSLKKIVGILDDLPWNEIGITLSTLSWNKDHGGAGHICGTSLYTASSLYIASPKTYFLIMDTYFDIRP